MTWDERIHKWATDRNLIDGSTPADQMTKLREEVDELITAVKANDDAGVIDGAGDVCVVLAVMAGQMGTTLAECEKRVRVSIPRVSVDGVEDALRMMLTEIGTGIEVQSEVIRADIGFFAGVVGQVVLAYCRERAWEQIKDRKGRMVDGVFEKEGE